MKIWEVINGLKPALMMAVVQVVFAIVNILYKLAANDGMSLQVMVAYRLIFAAAFMIPLALILERNSRPKMTWMILFQTFLCGLFGASLLQNLYAKSIDLVSATFASAMANLIPGVTLLLSLFLGLETLAIKTLSGNVKLFGTLIGIGGAMLFTFYKGLEIPFLSTHINLLHHHQNHQTHNSGSSPSTVTLILGLLCSFGYCFSTSVWYVIQAKMSQKYPCYYSSTALMCLMASVQSIVYALCTVEDKRQWRLGWDVRLLCVVYSGIMASGLMSALIYWCVHLKGPLFTSLFNPLMLIVVAFLGSLFLDEKLYLGSILGSVLIVSGLYLVLWSKNKEMKRLASTSSSQPSIESKSIEIRVGSNRIHRDRSICSDNSNIVSGEEDAQTQTQSKEIEDKSRIETSHKLI